MTHPLTDKICNELWWSVDTPDPEFHEFMRAAADWQLEQVIEYLVNYVDPTWHDRLTDEFETLVDDIQKAMRPQEDN